MTNFEVISVSAIAGSLVSIFATFVELLIRQPDIPVLHKRVAEDKHFGVPGAAEAQHHAQANIAGDAVAAAIPPRHYDRAFEREYLVPLYDQQRPIDEETLRKPGFTMYQIRILPEAMQDSRAAASVRERRCIFCGISMSPNEQDAYACNDDTVCFQRFEEQDELTWPMLLAATLVMTPAITVNIGHGPTRPRATAATQTWPDSSSKTMVGVTSRST